VAVSSPHLAIPAMTDDLQRVEQQLSASVQTSDPFLTEVASHLIRAGGKRQRPAFAVASAATALGTNGGRPATDEVVMGGVAVELVHLGSLYHDDVMDDATTRRTVESVNARWGNLKAILAGDFLLAKASEIAASLGTEVAGLLAATIGRLCEGQIRELKDAYQVARTEPDYTASISGKTAALFATACRVGGLVGELSRDDIETLTDFGERYGMAFQVVDDVLDVVATSEELGKPAGNDLVEGVYTLPVLRLLATGEADELRDMLGKPLDDEERERARVLVRSSGCIDEAIVVAQQYASEALDALAELGPSTAAEGLAGTTNQLVDRIASRAHA
jgi:heptaprenyl diphosphate synthase